jgi:hypothetical protein
LAFLAIRTTLFAMGCLSLALNAAVPRYKAEIVELNATSSLSGVSFIHGSGHLLIYGEFPAAYVWDGRNLVSTGGAPVLDPSGFGWSSYVCGSWGEGSAYCGVIFANGSSYQLPRRSAPGNHVIDFNSRGQFVGFEPDHGPFLWREGNLLELNTLLEGTNSLGAPAVINDEGIIYGWKSAQPAEKITLVRLTPNASGRYRFEQLQTFTNAYLHVSKNGFVAGPGFLWSESAGLASFDLGIAGQIQSFQVNSFAEVVGSARVPGISGTRGFLHAEATYDLNDIADLPPGITITAGYDINEYGQIAAIAAKGDRNYAVRLTAVPSVAVAGEAGSQVRLDIRPANDTPLRLETSTDLSFWSAIQTWNQPAPLESVHLDRDPPNPFYIGSTMRFFRVAR